MPPTAISYMGITIVLNTIEAIELLLDRSPTWTHFINLSGSDYPLVSQEALGDALDAASLDDEGRPIAVSFVEVWPNSNNSHHWKTPGFDSGLAGSDNGLIFYSKHWNTIPPPYPYEVGPAWVILSREFCEAVARGGEMRRLLVTLASTKVPDEALFQNFLGWTAAGRRLSKFVAGDSLRFYIPVFNESHPRWLDKKNLVDKAQASGAAFARKFRTGSKMIDYADRMYEANAEGIKDRLLLRMRKAVSKMLEKPAWKGPS
ncbi:hypothetical protein DFJ74DRAFT_678523, partial [Hyaloraphidium curvatum]